MDTHQPTKPSPRGRLNKDEQLIVPGFAPIAPTRDVQIIAKGLAKRAQKSLLRMLRQNSESVLQHQQALPFDQITTHLTQLHAVLLAAKAKG